MSLVIPHQGELHKVLTEVSEVIKESGGLSYAQEGDDSGHHALSSPGFSLGANSVDVPPPLKHIGFNFVCKHGHFSLISPVIATSESGFRGVSRKFGENFPEGQYVWSPVNARGAGYIIDGKSNVRIIAISTIGFPEISARAVALGYLGAEPRKIESEEDRFIEWVSLFESTLRNYVTAVYAANGRLKKWKSRSPLYLDCLM